MRWAHAACATPLRSLVILGFAFDQHWWYPRCFGYKLSGRRLPHPPKISQSSSSGMVENTQIHLETIMAIICHYWQLIAIHAPSWSTIICNHQAVLRSPTVPQLVRRRALQQLILQGRPIWWQPGGVVDVCLASCSCRTGATSWRVFDG